MRTSELSYLDESFTFYNAIEERKYFENLTNEKNLKSIFIKKLRYYLRFIVVCILQKKNKKIISIIESFKENLKKFQEIINEEEKMNFELSTSYLSIGNEKNIQDWKLVIKELENFLKFKNLIQISKEKQLVVFQKDFNFIESNSMSIGIIVGNNDKQIKYSELSLDMYRMLQSLERREKNPKKILLYRPTFSLLFNSISNSFHEMKKNEILFLYLNSNSNDKSILMRENEILSIEDLMPFTRKPLFLIVESKFTNSIIPTKNRFESPLIGLFSNDLNESIDGIGMLTWFLSNPIESLCYLFEIENISNDIYEKLDQILNKFYDEIIILLISLNEELNPSFKYFLGNSFTRKFLLRFIIYTSFLNILSKKNLPIIYPELSKEIFKDSIFKSTFQKIKSTFEKINF